jgi:Flp pilus assembly protein TadG
MKAMTNPGHLLGFTLMLLRDRRARLIATSDLGASAIEWVIISGLLIILVLGIGVIITNKVTQKASSLNLGLGA